MPRRPKPADAPADQPPESAATWEPTASLKPWDRNPRRHDKSLPHLMESIRLYGWGRPIVARTGTRIIVAGHGAWYAAQALGLDRVPVRFVDLTDAQARGLALADNRIPELSEDTDELAALLREAAEPIPGFESAPTSGSDARILGRRVARFSGHAGMIYDAQIWGPDVPR